VAQLDLLNLFCVDNDGGVVHPSVELLLVPGWLAGAWLMWRLPPLGRRSSEAAASVIVPCRDEESRLPALLASLRAQQPPPIEVIVVDDGSTDGTAAVARAGGARVVTAPALPDGWVGKSWACACGAREARGEVLVFLDADVTLASPDVVGRLAAEAARRGGLVSVQPYHRTERPYERLSAYFSLVALMGVDAFSPLRGRIAPSGAFGACLACRREEYESAGGHHAVRAEIVEDLALSRRFARTTLFAGRRDLAFRMYPGGPAQLLEGWTKNVAAGAAAVRPFTSILIAAWITASLLAPRHAWSYAAFAAQLAVLLARVGRFGWLTAALFPVPLAFFVAVFARSAFLLFVRRRVRWRGRDVAVGRQ
jgi:4,4'-diaponeurosporenoate glycosyltransferase